MKPLLWAIALCAGAAVAQEKADLANVEPELAVSAVDFQPGDGLLVDERGPCVGDKDINGSGTTPFNMPLGTLYKDGRTTSIYLASQFACEGGPIMGMRYYVSTVPGQPLNAFMIRMRQTTETSYPSGAGFDPTGWVVVYGPLTQTISTTGWFTFTFTTPFPYDGVRNLEVDVTFNNSTYTTDGYVWSFSSSPDYRTIYKRCDDCQCPTGGPTNPADWGPTCIATRSYNVPRVQFIFPAPTTGACCLNYECVATNTEPECAAMGGTWYGGEDCATFYCPPWNDNCAAVTPVELEPGTPYTFAGNNLGATNDCGLFPGGQVWHAITLDGVPDSFFDVWLDYCGTNNDGYPFGNAWLNWATGCPCTGITPAGTYDWTICGDGNVHIQWSGLASGTYYYPVLLDPANHAAGNYIINVGCAQSYCSSYATNTADETLKTVQIGTIDNTTLDCDTYNDFTYLSTDLIAGATYPFNIVIGDCENANCYSKRLAIFIDLNDDFDFADAGERVYNSGQLTNSPCPDFPLSGQITIPPTATVGCTRMRIVVVETSSTDPSPCGTYTWGATEDYTVCILPPPPEGACCFGMSCAPDMYQSDCEAAGGRYKGDGTTCTPLNPCFGACCLLDGSCVETIDSTECAAMGGAYSGDGTNCSPNLCPQPGDNCLDPKVVTLPAGVPYAETNTTCGHGNDYSDTCLGYYDGGEDILYRLEIPDGICIQTLTVTGATPQDNWIGVTVDDSCPPDPNTCLATATSGSGNVATISDLTLPAGTYYMMIDTWPTPNCIDYTLSITPCPLPGACCFPDGSCQMLLATDCAAAGGVFQGDNVPCDPNPCPPPVGACCYPSGTCLRVTAGACAATGGQYQGDQTTCETTTCPIMPFTGMQLIDMNATADPIVGPGGTPIENISISLCEDCPTPTGYMDCGSQLGLIYWPVRVNYTVAGQPYELETVFAGTFMIDPGNPSRFFAFDMGYIDHPELGPILCANDNKNDKQTGPINLLCTDGGTTPGTFEDLTEWEYMNYERPWLVSAMPVALTLLQQLHPEMPPIPPEVLENMLATYDQAPATDLVFWFAITNEYRSSNLTGTDAWKFVVAPRGACCVGTVCLPNLTEAQCVAEGGIWQGADTVCFPSPCLPPPPPDYYFDPTGPQGGNGYQDQWYLYPNFNWVNMWWDNEFSLTRQKIIHVSLDVWFPQAGAVTIALNWDTPAWTEQGLARPPLPSDVPTPDLENLYIGRQVLETISSSMVPPYPQSGHFEFDATLPFCPDWVSMDVQGNGYQVQGTITHICLPPVETGACCVGTVCYPNMTQADCTAQGGVWQGAGTVCFPNPCIPPPDYYYDPTGPQGGNGYQDQWYLYPNFNWVNMWWPNEFALDRQKLIHVALDVGFPQAGAVTIALNWDTPPWTQQGFARPPLPADVPTPDLENLYIGRQILETISSSMVPPYPQTGHFEFDFVLPFCPDWVSMDVQGNGYQVQGTIVHVCLPGGNGACCLPGSICQVVSSQQCAAMGGTFKGGGTTCNPNPCICVGDLNCDGVVNFGDINPFVMFLSNFPLWQQTYPGCPPQNGDINGDGTYGTGSFADINPFVALIVQSPIVCQY